MTVEELPVHSHTVYIDNLYCAVLTENKSEWKQGLINANKEFSNGSHYCGATGGDAAHNNMEPYVAVYIFKRSS